MSKVEKKQSKKKTTSRTFKGPEAEILNNLLPVVTAIYKELAEGQPVRIELNRILGISSQKPRYIYNTNFKSPRLEGVQYLDFSLVWGDDIRRKGTKTAINQSMGFCQ